MSTPPPTGTLLETWIGGLPTITFWRIWLFAAPGKTTIPFEFPIALFASIRLFTAVARMPIPKLIAGPVA
jgi:hypothetical protein